MRSLATRIIDDFPAELRRVIDAEDRVLPGEPVDALFDNELDALADAVAGTGDFVHGLDVILDSIGEATRIQRRRDAQRARRSEIDVIARLLGRLPYPTREAIGYALRTQDHYPTARDEDRATEQLREALKLAGLRDER